MRCPNCGVDSINWMICSHCGHRFDSRTGPHWLSTTLYIILVIVFLPIGLCGGAFAVASFMPKSEYDSTFVAPALMIALPSLVIGTLVVYHALKAIFRRGKD